MKRLILLLLLLPLLVSGQNRKKAAFYALSQAGGGDTPYVFDYTDIPARPTLGTSATITYSAPGNILNSTGGTTQDKIPPSGGGLTVGTSTITTGSNTKILYDNSGVLGEYTVSGLIYTQE